MYYTKFAFVVEYRWRVSERAGIPIQATHWSKHLVYESTEIVTDLVHEFEFGSNRIYVNHAESAN